MTQKKLDLVNFASMLRAYATSSDALPARCSMPGLRRRAFRILQLRGIRPSSVSASHLRLCFCAPLLTALSYSSLLLALHWA